MFSNNKIKIIASLLSAFILLVGIIVIMSSNMANDLLKDRIENQFLSESFGRGEAIRSLLEVYSNQINHLVYRLSADQDVADILLANEHGPDNNNNYGPSNNTYNGSTTILGQKAEEYGATFDNSTYIKNIKIMDRNGNVLLSLNSSERGNMVFRVGDTEPDPKSTANYGTTNIEINKAGDENRQLIEFTMPFKVQQQQVSSVGNIENSTSDRSFFISTSLDTNSFDKILLNRKGLGESGEAYLVNSSKVMVSESRFIDSKNPITVDTLAVRQCFENTEGKDTSGIYNDYRNIPIVGFSYCAKDLGFVLLAEIDKSEVMQPIDNLRNTMVITSVVSCFILTVISIVVIHTLLSWNKRLESANKQLQSHDKMQREFINIAAHELKTPIQPILALTERIREKTKDGDMVQMLDVVIRNAQRLKKLSDNILDVTKIESNSLKMSKELFSLDELVLDTIRDFENNLKGKGIKFEYHSLNDFECIVLADKIRIGQVISNMIGNSAKFIGKEGTISITVERKKCNDGGGIGGKDKDAVVVCVKDTGTGIDTEMLPKIFTKFASKSFQGTGLGLYISKKIVEAHGGMVMAENNNDGIGAKFSFVLPLESSV